MIEHPGSPPRPHHRVSISGILLEQALADETALVEEGEVLEAEWKSIWQAAPFEPLPAEAMLDWLTAHEYVLGAIEDREQQKSDMMTFAAGLAKPGTNCFTN